MDKVVIYDNGKIITFEGNFHYSLNREFMEAEMDGIFSPEVEPNETKEYITGKIRLNIRGTVHSYKVEVAPKDLSR